MRNDALAHDYFPSDHIQTRTRGEIIRDFAEVTERELYDKFYRALPITSPKFRNLYTEITSMAQELKRGIKL
jgi:hypothetical protein